MKAAREEEHGRERERLASELARARKEWADAQRQLETERDRSRVATGGWRRRRRRRASRRRRRTRRRGSSGTSAPRR